MLSLLAAPFAACLVIAALHCYMGLHVIRRGVIFVDLALAQVAALGGAVAVILAPSLIGDAHDHAEQADPIHLEQGLALDAADWFEEDTGMTDRGIVDESGTDRLTYAFSLAFALLGAALFALGRFRDERVPHEAIIGIVYVVSAALAMLVLSKSPHGHEETEAMLLGSILFVDWGDVAKTGALYAVLAALHAAWGRKFLMISENTAAAEASGINVRLYDFLFYGIFGVMVTQSVRIGGVFVVFSFLIIPGVCATMLLSRFRSQLILAWMIALAASVGGLWFSAVVDMPTGSSLVTAFGMALVVSVSIYAARRRPAATSP